MSALIEVERRPGRVQVWRIDHPPHNFMNREMVGELGSLVDEVGRDPSTGAVVITGAPPKRFCTHYDVAEILAGTEQLGMQVAPRLAGATFLVASGLSRLPGVEGALRRTPAAGLLELRDLHQLFLRMNRLGTVFVAAINGPAGGGGCELALACDLRLMADDAERIGLPEMTMGFCPGAGGTQRLARILGPARALEMILEARTLQPREALEAGVVHRVVPAAELLEAALGTAERLARRAPVAVAAAKHAVYEGASASLDEGMAIERNWFLAAASRPAAKRAMRAYVQDLERTGAPAWADTELLGEWQQGTRVDMTSDR